MTPVGGRLVHRAAQVQLTFKIIDVSGAFLQAPRHSSQTTMVELPQILKTMNLIQDDELWEGPCALHELQERRA